MLETAYTEMARCETQLILRQLWGRLCLYWDDSKRDSAHSEQLWLRLCLTEIALWKTSLIMRQLWLRLCVYWDMYPWVRLRLYWDGSEWDSTYTETTLNWTPLIQSKFKSEWLFLHWDGDELDSLYTESGSEEIRRLRLWWDNSEWDSAYSEIP